MRLRDGHQRSSLWAWDDKHRRVTWMVLYWLLRVKVVIVVVFLVKVLAQGDLRKMLLLLRVVGVLLWDLGSQVDWPSFLSGLHVHNGLSIILTGVFHDKVNRWCLGRALFRDYHHVIVWLIISILLVKLHGSCGSCHLGKDTCWLREYVSVVRGLKMRYLCTFNISALIFDVKMMIWLLSFLWIKGWQILDFQGREVALMVLDIL
jgi:hypothetical protein